MISITFNNKRIEIPHETIKKDGYVCTKLSNKIDFKNIERIEAELFDNVAAAENNGYMVLSRGDGCNDYTLCFFERHKEDFEREIKESNIAYFRC